MQAECMLHVWIGRIQERIVLFAPDQKGTTTGGRSESIISASHQPEQDIAPI